MRISEAVHRLRRRWFGRYKIDDPRPIAEDAPYTYFLPSENELLALALGDLAKLVFRSIPPSPEWDAERMWVTITAVEGDRLEGRLDNQPWDMPQLRPGAGIPFCRSDVIDILWQDDRSTPPPPSPERREYWDRCLVDGCIVDDRIQVHYLYREEPDLDLKKPDDKYPDSGWRIRGDYRGLNDSEIDARKLKYIALGPVLNVDDSWLHLIDAPVGSAFIRDWDTGEFVADPDDR